MWFGLKPTSTNGEEKKKKKKKKKKKATNKYRDYKANSQKT